MVFNVFKRLSVVKDLVLHKLDAIAFNLENQTALQQQSSELQRQSSDLLSNKLEKLIQDQQESIKATLLAQSSELHSELKALLQGEIKALLQSELNGKLGEPSHQQSATSSSNLDLKILHTAAQDFLVADKFSEAQELYEYVLLSDPTNQSLIDKIEFLKKITAIPLDWSDPNYVSPNKAYFPMIPPINIELSSHCNLKCPYCANATLERDYVKMEDQLLNRIIEQCKLLNLQIIALHGVGEPLLRKDLEIILTKLRETGIWQGCLTSNCTLLTLDRMKSLREAGVVFLYCSVDTLDAELYRKTRGGDVRKTLANIQSAASNFPDVHFVVGLMNHKLQVITPEIEREFNQIFENLPNVKMAPYESLPFPGAAEDWRRDEYKMGSPTCSQPAPFFTIDATGLVALCCVDQNTAHVLGDLKTQTIAEIWYNKKNQETFRNIALGVHGCPDVCFKCILSPTDKGIDSIDPVLYSPILHLLDTAENAFQEGKFQTAQKLYEHALTREPYNSRIKEKTKTLGTITGIKSHNGFQEYMENML